MSCVALGKEKGVHMRVAKELRPATRAAQFQNLAGSVSPVPEHLWFTVVLLAAQILH